MRQLQGNCIEQNMPLCSVFIYLVKTFDIIKRKALWIVLEHIRCPQRVVKLNQLFHDGMIDQVLSSDDMTVFCSQQWHETNLCLSPSSFQPLFQVHAVSWNTRSRGSNLYSILSGLLPFWPSSQCQNKDSSTTTPLQGPLLMTVLS